MAVLVIGTAAAWGMVGVIWIVQLVQYPMLATYIGSSPNAAEDHQRRILPVVGPLMLVEGITALVLLVDRPATMHVVAAWVAAGLLGVALASTAFVQVPLHRRLAAGDDPIAAERLVTTNWIRTGAWTARGLVLAAVLAT